LTAIAIINDDLKIRVTVLVIAILITFLIPRLTGPIYSWWYSKRPEGIIIESKSQELTLTEKGRSEVYGHIHNEYRIKGNPKRNTEFPFHVIVEDFNDTGLAAMRIKLDDKEIPLTNIKVSRERITRKGRRMYDYTYRVPIEFTGAEEPILTVEYETYEFKDIMEKESLTMNIRDQTRMMSMTVRLDEELCKRYVLKKKNEAGNPYLITNVNGATDDHLMRTIRQKPKISNNC